MSRSSLLRQIIQRAGGSATGPSGGLLMGVNARSWLRLRGRRPETECSPGTRSRRPGLHPRQRKQNRCQAFGGQAIDRVALNVGLYGCAGTLYTRWLASPADPSPQETKKGRTLRPAPTSLFCSDGIRISNPCRPYRPSHPYRHHLASQVPSSPASPRPSPRWSPIGRRPKPHPAVPSAPPWSDQRCRPSPGP